MFDMKLGYPCINSEIGCSPNRTFRLASYSDERLIQTTRQNLECLMHILEYNLSNGLYFFRIGSSLVPFASHQVCTVDWRSECAKEFKMVGDLVKSHAMRISMHPDQFVVLNSPRQDVVARSVAELLYHCQALDAMGLDRSAKVMIHGGGVYGDKDDAKKRFVSAYRKLPRIIRKRLVVEHDDKIYSLRDCLDIWRQTGIPIVFDTFHHECLNDGESLRDACNLAMGTWKKTDGPLILHYSSQEKGSRKGSHAQTLDPGHFRHVVKQLQGLNYDMMLEIKDKQISAVKARTLLSGI